MILPDIHQNRRIHFETPKAHIHSKFRDFSRSGKTNFHRKGGPDKYTHFNIFNEDYDDMIRV